MFVSYLLYYNILQLVRELGSVLNSYSVNVYANMNIALTMQE